MAMHSTVAPSASTADLALSSLFGMRGRRVLITGGGSGLGAYAAITYALQGAKVYVVGRRLEKLEGVRDDFEKRKPAPAAGAAAKEGSITPIQGDVSSKDSVKAIADAYGKHESHMDVLINGAGIISKAPKVNKTDGMAVVKALFEDDWENFTNLFNINVVGLHYMTLAAAPYLAKAEKPSLRTPGPVVLNITSIAGHHILREASMPYQTSKDAAEKVTKILAGRLQPLQIRVNAIAPGIFPSEMTNAIDPGAYNDPSHPLHEQVKNNPMGRSGTPEDFAGIVLFLGSRAGAYVNGASIVIDGGRLLGLSAA